VTDTELLTVYNEEGQPAGTKTREQVHEDGDWHAVVFVLAASSRGRAGRRLLLQLRSGDKDSYEGLIDVLAAGHVAASETTQVAALREFQEEVGIKLKARDLIELGGRRLQLPAGVCRRAIQTFYLCLRPLSLEQATFNQEVEGFLDVDLDEFGDFINRSRPTVRARGRLRSSGSRTFDTVITWSFVEGYPPEIIDNFRRCVQSVSNYFDSGRVDRGFWE
jgi:8-oxo-dGTP pyrophosphatase MutT (NUDIX family)